jgi:hypothetical protein
VEWKVERSNGIKESYSGKEITLSSAEAITGEVTVRATYESGATAVNDAAWGNARMSIRFEAPRRLLLSVTAPRLGEVNQPMELVGGIKTPWDNSVAALPMASAWELPNGETAAVASYTAMNAGNGKLVWTPKVAGSKEAPTFVAWVEGFREQTETRMQPKILVRQYAFPSNWQLELKSVGLQAPASIRLAAQTTPAEFKEFQAAGGKLKYTWSLPSNVTGAKANGAGVVFTADSVGQYTVSVKIEDTRGNSVDVERILEVVEPVPYKFEIRMSSDNKALRNPTKMLYRVNLSGGHPKDKIASYDFTLNGQKVGDSKKNIFSFDLPEAGEYELGFVANSVMGRAITGSEKVTVVGNKPPVCTVTARGVQPKQLLTATCKDEDGKIKSYQWKIDGVPLSVSGNRLTVTAGALYELTVTDDSGGNASASGSL